MNNKIEDHSGVSIVQVIWPGVMKMNLLRTPLSS